MRRVITDHGFCFSYNLLDYNSIFNADVISDDFDSYKGPVFSQGIFKNLYNSTDVKWTLGKGYSKNGQVPFRISKRHKFQVQVELSTYLVYNCEVMNKNYKIFFHLPHEYPNRFHAYKYIESSGSKRIFLTAEYYDSDPEMRKFPPENRECYFEGERHLKFFKSYTQKQCHYECLTNFTLSQCGCVKFSMPRDNHTPICNFTEVVCYEEALSDWLDLDVQKKCDCLASCVDIKYDLVDDDSTMEFGRCAIYHFNYRIIIIYDLFQILGC